MPAKLPRSIGGTPVIRDSYFAVCGVGQGWITGGTRLQAGSTIEPGEITQAWEFQRPADSVTEVIFGDGFDNVPDLTITAVFRNSTGSWNDLETQLKAFKTTCENATRVCRYDPKSATPEQFCNVKRLRNFERVPVTNPFEARVIVVMRMTDANLWY
jgi:hypothetical protein